jgi:DNA-binding HxlR family transcriptional regulator
LRKSVALIHLEVTAMTAANTRTLSNQGILRIARALRNGPLRFNEIDRAINAPNPPILSKLLKKMQRDGLIVRNVVQLGPPAHVEYALTDLGSDLSGPATTMIDWIDTNVGKVEAARAVSRLQAEDTPAVLDV